MGFRIQVVEDGRTSGSIPGCGGREVLAESPTLSTFATSPTVGTTPAMAARLDQAAWATTLFRPAAFAS